MRSWARAALASALDVSDRPLLWLPGGLAWVVTAGWVALVAGVARPPTQAELTFLGARFYTSGAWPWNLLVVLAVALLVVGAGLALASLAEVALQRRERWEPRDVRRVLAVTLVCVAPFALAAAMVTVGAAAVAPAEFNAPGEGARPMIRIAFRIWPLLAGTALIGMACGAWHAAATRTVLAGRSVVDGLFRAPARLARHPLASVLQAVAVFVLRVASIVVAAVLLRVLWTPIEGRIARAGFDLAIAALLVGFVAIWLCLVLGGGALHAWGSATWTAVLGEPERASTTAADRRSGA